MLFITRPLSESYVTPSGSAGFSGSTGADSATWAGRLNRSTKLFSASLTQTLPLGKPADVKRELQWLVKYGPKRGLFLGASSSITPGVPWENLKTLVDGFLYYRDQARN